MSKRKQVLDFTGFEDLMHEIDRAGGHIKRIVENCANKVTTIAEDELRGKVERATDSESLKRSIKVSRPKWSSGGSGNVCSGHVGWEIEGKPNPRNLSEGFKSVYLNYGTSVAGREHIKKRLYIRKAKTAIRKKIQTQKIYEKAFDEALKGLKK